MGKSELNVDLKPFSVSAILALIDGELRLLTVKLRVRCNVFCL